MLTLDLPFFAFFVPWSPSSSAWRLSPTCGSPSPTVVFCITEYVVVGLLPYDDPGTLLDGEFFAADGLGIIVGAMFSLNACGTGLNVSAAS